MSSTRLSLYAYAYQSDVAEARSDYGPIAENLSFTTVAPGGWGEMSCHFKTGSPPLPDPRTPPPELGLFANVALIDSTGFVAFQGRWDEPGILLTESGSDGDLFEMHALGASAVLQDDPDDVAYTNKTAQYILGQEISRRSNYLTLDQDTTQILPDNPSSQYSPAFQGKNLEEELNELSPVVGDYQWAVWNHAQHKDNAGFPTWQLYWHARDTTTVAYTAYTADEVSHDFRPAIEYTYNVITLFYRDAGTNTPAFVTVKDSRLAANGSQGNAPFPWRRLRKDIGGTHLSSAEALNIANALLAQYQNGSYKISVVLHTLRDANGNEIPLHQARADTNILLPELSPTGVQLPTTPTLNVNLYYIHETRYEEGQGQEPRLTLTLDTFYDTTGFQIARMQYREEGRVKTKKHHSITQAAGEPEQGQFGATFNNVAAGSQVGITVNFKTLMSAAPTSITVNLIAQANVSGFTITDITNYGFTALWTPTSTGSSYYKATYVTVGN